MIIIKLDRNLPCHLTHQLNIKHIEDHDDNVEGRNITMNIINGFFFLSCHFMLTPILTHNVY